MILVVALVTVLTNSPPREIQIVLFLEKMCIQLTLTSLKEGGGDSQHEVTGLKLTRVTVDYLLGLEMEQSILLPHVKHSNFD